MTFLERLYIKVNGGGFGPVVGYGASLHGFYSGLEKIFGCNCAGKVSTSRPS